MRHTVRFQITKLTTGREIASRRRLKKSKVKKSKSFHFSTFRDLSTFRDFSGLFDFSFFWSLFGTFRLFATFRFSGHFSTFRDFSTFRFSGHFSGLFDFSRLFVFSGHFSTFRDFSTFRFSGHFSGLFDFRDFSTFRHFVFLVTFRLFDFSRFFVILRLCPCTAARDHSQIMTGSNGGVSMPDEKDSSRFTHNPRLSPDRSGCGPLKTVAQKLTDKPRGTNPEEMAPLLEPSRIPRQYS